ncbi:MAG TPA: acyl-CoA reductase, partial [Xanthomarina gelatinilytica]|nr:acyl-CoA reductase [Xanthomarina gelatinilytica]
MNLEERIKAFATLGTFLGQFSRESYIKKDSVPQNELFFDGFKHQIKLAKEHNGWFTEEQVGFALENWSKALTYNNIKQFADTYCFKDINPKKVAVIMAGNIPLVGFHDFFCVLLVGHKVLVKQSSNDKHLLPYLAIYLEQVAPGFKGQIEFTEEKLRDFDAVIATGSDNTARYFEYYFKGKPSIIRKNRNSVAVLTGNETDA